jgi:hypothetical protein
MSFKIKVLVVTAPLTVVSGAGMAGALTAGAASAATPPCGPACINLFSYQFGSYKTTNYTVDVLRRDEKVGPPIILIKTTNFDPAEDWSLAFQGTMAGFHEAGLIDADHTLRYGCVPPVNFPDCYGQISVPVNDPAYAIEYAPYGGDSGLCAGVTAAAYSGEEVTLPPGGVPAKTLGIADINNPATLLTGSVPPINDSNTNFSQPFVLTHPVSSYRTGTPLPQLQVGNITGRQAVQPGGTA